MFTLLFLLAALFMSGKVAVAGHGDPVEHYADDIAAYQQTLNDIAADAAKFGWSKPHMDEAIAASAQVIAHVKGIDLPDCLDEERMLFIDMAISTIALAGYANYQFNGEAGVPLEGHNLDLFQETINHPYTVWMAYQNGC
jgi:hypothetical protein